MKTRSNNRYTSIFVVGMLLIVIIQLSSCGGGDDPTPPPPADNDELEEVKAKLVGTWTVQSVNVDGVDKSLVYEGLKVTFTESTITTANGGPAWPASGTWTFSSTDGTRITRGDGLEVLVEVTATTLKLTMTLSKTTLSGGRIESVQGKNVFTFIK